MLPSEERTLTRSVSEMLDRYAARTARVLDVGEIDERSRYELAWMYRDMGHTAARMGEQPRLEHEDEEPASELADGAYHVGALYMLQHFSFEDHRHRTYVGDRAIDALQVVGITFCDEADAMSRRALRAVPGIGPKAVASIREALDAYYWRGDPTASRELWECIAARLRRMGQMGYVHAWIETRIADGLTLAELVLDEAGAPLIADPSAVRMVS